MNQRSVLLIVLAVLLAVGCLWYNYADWFGRPTMEIEHDIRPNSPGRRGGRSPVGADQTANTVAFFFTQKYQLTSVKVVPLAEFKTNKYVQPLWHLISDSNSVPVKSLVYGVPVRGMRPDVKGGRAMPLQPEVAYRLLLEAGRIKGEHDFTTTEKTPAAP